MTDPHPSHGPSPDPGGSPPAADPALRRKADAAYRARMAGLPDPFEASWPEPARALVHELRVHQIELEMQNEELRRLQVELDATRARYFDLFDLAPVGYLLVRENGLILQSNLTAAAMLGEVRGVLTDRPVSRSIFQADQDAFCLCRRRLADTGEPQSCELRVVKPGGAHVWVLVAMSAACADDGTPLHRVTLTDIGESKRAEAVQRESEERLRVALTAAAAIGFVWDAASDAVVRYFSTVPSLPVNVDAPEPVAAVRARVHPDDVGLFEAGVAECLVEGTEYRNLYRVVDPGGSIRWLQEWGTLSRDAAGRPLRLTGISIDVTDRKRAEAALRASEERLQLALTAGRMGSFDWDLATNAVIWSDTHYKLFGYTAGERFPIEYHHFADRVHPDDLQAVEQAIRTAMEQRTTYKCEHRLLLPDGIVRWILGTGEFQYDSDGRPVRMLGIVSDITDRKQAEEALIASEARARAVINSSPVPMALIDHAQRITFLNLAFTRTFGYVLGDIPTLADWWAKAYPDLAYRQWVAENWQAELTRSDQTGTAFAVMDLTIRCKDRTDRFVEANAAPLADTFAGTHLVVLHDITERKRADTDRRTLEDQLRQAQKMEAVGRLAGGVAHDFNNLLTVINCHSEIALSETEPGDPLREPMAAIRDAGERAANLTQQLLAFSRRAIVALRVLDLNEVVASTTKMLRRLISEDIAFATVLCPTPCRVRIDPGQIEQVIMNLAVNARDAMPNGGRLTIETNHHEVFRATPDCPPGRYVRLTVTDTGTGMSEDEKARIFEPFFTTKEVGMGTGLGLATVYGIVKQARGHIRVESTIAKGTTFEVMFPEAESSVTDRPSDSIRFSPRGAETILLAEDEDAVRKVTRLGLEMQGYMVIETGTVAEAIATAASYPGPIQLLVTDVIMPELGGRELADAIRANRPDIRVLYVSGYTSDALVRHGVEQGVDSFLQKPFTPLTLARKVRMVLDAPAPGVIS